MKKQICMIAYTNYSSDARVRREAEALVSTGEFEVAFLALMEGKLARTYELEGVRVIELGVRKYRGHNALSHFISYMKFFFLALCRCSGLFLAGKADMVHVHNIPNFLVFAGILPRLAGKPMILDVHDSTPETYGARYSDKPNRVLLALLRWEEALCCGFANEVICVNEVQREALVARGIPLEKTAVSMNVPDPKWFRMVPAARSDRPGNNIKLVYHGTVARRLGIDLAIRALARLRNEGPDIEFYVFGSGEGLAECIALTKELGLARNVYFNEKMLPVEQLLGLLNGMDIGVVTNRRNPATELMLPVKLMEYVALGIPAVAPRLRTIERYFTDDMVRYFEPDNVDSLAGAISDLCKDISKRKSQAERAGAFLERYGWEAHGKSDFIGLYKKI